MKSGWTCLKLSKDVVVSCLRHFVLIVDCLHAFPTHLKIILGWARIVWERVWCKPALSTNVSLTLFAQNQIHTNTITQEHTKDNNKQ